VPQRVRADAGQAGARRGGRDEVVHRLPGQRPAALGDERPGQRVGAGGEVAPDGAQLVAGDRLLDRAPALEAANPEPGAVEVELVPAQADGLADPQPAGREEMVGGRARGRAARRLLRRGGGPLAGSAGRSGPGVASGLSRPAPPAAARGRSGADLGLTTPTVPPSP
jgi:hypothetical protein